MIESFRERETTTRLAAPMSFGSRTRMRSVTTAPMSKENEIGKENKIGNDGADEQQERDR